MMFSTRQFLAFLLSALPLTQAATLNDNAITFPLEGDVITAGQPVGIKWTNIKGNTITITLMDGPANQLKPVRVVTSNSPNIGVFTWSVPDDLPTSETYGLRIAYNNNPADWNYSGRFTFDNENAVSSAAVSSKAESTTDAATATTSSADSTETESATSVTSAATTESESASTTAASTESESTSSAASTDTETETSRATTMNTRASSTTTSRESKTTATIQTGMAPVDNPSSASRSISDRSLGSLIVAIAGVTVGGAFFMF